ncbi:MAG: PAS domain-containing protein [Pseudomonadota bacterium]
MDKLEAILNQNEEWLMGRILEYAKKRGYTAYTSTLKEAWRLSISGLSASIFAGLRHSLVVPEMGPDDDFASDPIAQFGIVEAQRHRERGIDLGMFLGLMKYYRQAYLDLIEELDVEPDAKQQYALYLARAFDRIEIGFCVEWSGADENKAMHDLQVSNRLMTNEKNKYLTIFETIPNPVIILNKAKKIEDMNLAAAELFQAGAGAGAQNYHLSRDRRREADAGSGPPGEAIDPGCFGGAAFFKHLPFIRGEVNRFFKAGDQSAEFERTAVMGDKKIIFRVKLSKSLDVSERFDGVLVILEDITSLRQALEEVGTLRGFIPICSNCKNIRDDHGYWQKVEQYVQEHSEAQFSHGICPDCAKKLYPEYYVEEDHYPPPAPAAGPGTDGPGKAPALAPPLAAPREKRRGRAAGPPRR